MKFETVVDRIRKLAKEESESWNRVGNACYAGKGRGDIGNLFDAACAATDELILFVGSVTNRSDTEPDEVTISGRLAGRFPQEDKQA